jgi:stage II sporulation protein D
MPLAPRGRKKCSPGRKPRDQMPKNEENLYLPAFSQGLRRGLHSFALSGLRPFIHTFLQGGVGGTPALPGQKLARVWTKGALALFLLLGGRLASAQDVRIGVFGLFSPHQLTVTVFSGAAIVLSAGKESFVLEGSSGRRVASVRVAPGGLLLQVGGQQIPATEIHVAGRSHEAADFVLSVPGKISRHYRGTLQVTAASDRLLPVVAMDLETAVASAVQAESLSHTPLEALKAQSVATRSYFAAAKGRHRKSDFCDTTHCQYLREPPAAESAAALAAAATRGLVLAYHEQPLAAMYTRSCGGRTRTPAEIGIPSRGYPYFAVTCDYCRSHPSLWRRRISESDANKLLRRGEAARLEIDRRLGWDAIPSCSFTTHNQNQDVVLEGTGEGHGVGLCQLGARAMAEAGASFREILAHFYPNTDVVRFSVSAASFERHTLCVEE